jgi:flagellar basal-body rod modification protein FlgD
MSTIDTLGPAGRTTGTAAGNAFSALDSEQFVKIMFTELQQQDPLQPSSSKDLLQQLSSLRSIQSDMDLSERLKALVLQNQMSAASGLIGRRVSGLDAQQRRIEGEVVSISRTRDGAVLNLRGGGRIDMDSMDQVLAAAAATEGGGQ